MSRSKNPYDELVEIFEKTFEDKKFSRGEKKTIAQLLAENYDLNKDQRSQLRSKIFDIARGGLACRGDRAVLDWLETANKLLLNPGDAEVCFSPGTRCRGLIVEQLRGASTHVDICVFTISDNGIAEAINDCFGRGVAVRVITDNDKAEDRGSDVKELAVAGVQVRVDRSVHHMHHKFALFDRRRVLTGSYNWTRSAAEENQENLLLLDDKKVVSAYLEEFERLWDSMLPYRGE